jgi:hypothetical protein
MNPWTHCRRRYDAHFFDQMKGRSLPLEQVQQALAVGQKTPTSAKEPDGSQDYDIDWNKWTIRVTRFPCRIVLHTAFQH